MDVREYIKSNGQSPFGQWLKKIDRSLALRVRARLARIASTGNLGDLKVIKGTSDLYELRLMFGKGYRVYFGKDGPQLIILLIGGDKSTQNKDIKKATEYWEDYNA